MTRTVQADVNQRTAAYHFTQDSQPTVNPSMYKGSNSRNRELEVTKMYQFSGNHKRIPYARALYLSAVAALLSACTQTEPVSPADVTSTGEVAMRADVPEVVITARRVDPDFNG